MKIERDSRLDVIKATAIIFVLIWHLHPISFFIDENSHAIIFTIAKIIKDLELQLTLTAVPLFYIISVYLFFLKKPDKNYLKNRIIKIIKIFGFWSIFHNLFLLLITKEIPNYSWELIIGLKPAIPFVGDSVFYFLFNLILLTIIAFFYQSCSDKLIKFISSVIIIFSLLYFEAITIKNSAIPYHWLINFIIYIPISYYLAHYPAKIFKFKYLYVIAYILFSMQDIHLRNVGYYGSIYGRVSIICGALSIFCFIYSFKFKENWCIQKLSKYSLGLFAIHKYWQSLLLLGIQMSQINVFTSFAGIPLNFAFFFIGILVVLLTTITIYLLQLTNLKQFVS